MAAGCFDASALSVSSHHSSDGLKLEEIDIGAYHVTLPQMSGEAAQGVVNFHAFGRVARRNRSQVAKVLKSRGPEIRAHVLTSMRGLDPRQLAEPSLDAVRDELASVVNHAIEKDLVEGVGFYKFAFSRK